MSMIFFSHRFVSVNSQSCQNMPFEMFLTILPETHKLGCQMGRTLSIKSSHWNSVLPLFVFGTYWLQYARKMQFNHFQLTLQTCLDCTCLFLARICLRHCNRKSLSTEIYTIKLQRIRFTMYNSSSRTAFVPKKVRKKSAMCTVLRPWIGPMLRRQ